MNYANLSTALIVGYVLAKWVDQEHQLSSQSISFLQIITKPLIDSSIHPETSHIIAC